MSGSKKSLRNAVVFNPRASNEWSKDESKFGQRMLEKMGWKHGQGIGLNNQGITENIKVRLKLDSKGLGYQIKEDGWLEVRSEFSELLSQLSQGVGDEDDAFNKAKKSLEEVSQSSKTRVHYRKFTHGKDIARYKKEDLIGILGKRENEESAVPENKEFIQSGNIDEYFKSKTIKPKQNDLDTFYENNPCVDQTVNSNLDLVQDEHFSILEDSNSISNLKKRKKSKKMNNKDESEKSFEKELIERNSSIQGIENSKKKECCDFGSLPKKKRRNSELSCESSTLEIIHQVSKVNEKDIGDSKDDGSLQKRKTSTNKLQNDKEIEELGEKVICQQAEETNYVANRLCNEKNSDQCKILTCTIEPDDPLESIRDRVGGKNENTVVNLTTNLDEKVLLCNDGVEENNVVDVRLRNSNEKKKKKSKKKSNEISSKVDPEVTEIMCEEQELEDLKNRTCRKKKKKTCYPDSNSSEVGTLVVVIDDSPRESEKSKCLSVKLTNTCLDMKNKKDFMKSVIDFNTSNIVEDYISNFEEKKEKLMNKYREKYKMKYLISSSDQIQVIGDEFDGRKLDCKKTEFKDLSMIKVTDRKKLSKAEKIIAKSRLLKGIEDSIVTHNFEGSNLTNISGYGSDI